MIIVKKGDLFSSWLLRTLLRTVYETRRKHQLLKTELVVYCCIYLTAPTQILSSGQGLRLAAPGSTTVLRTVPAGQVAQLAQMQGGKQIITVKAGQVTSSQPQIVTLVKTTQGMQVAQVSFLYRCYSSFTCLPCTSFEHAMIFHLQVGLGTVFLCTHMLCRSASAHVPHFQPSGTCLALIDSHVHSTLRGYLKALCKFVQAQVRGIAVSCFSVGRRRD